MKDLFTDRHQVNPVFETLAPFAQGKCRCSLLPFSVFGFDDSRASISGTIDFSFLVVTATIRHPLRALLCCLALSLSCFLIDGGYLFLLFVCL